jgi:hypothetical protein
MEPKCELFELVHAFSSSGCCACLLHCRQQKTNQYAYDGDDNKKFDERKALRRALMSR